MLSGHGLEIPLDGRTRARYKSRARYPEFVAWHLRLTLCSNSRNAMSYLFQTRREATQQKPESSAEQQRKVPGGTWRCPLLNFLMPHTVDEGEWVVSIRTRMQIDDVRELLGDLATEMPSFLSDGTIRRFLLSRNWSTEKAAKALKEAVKWRRQFKPETICWVLESFVTIYGGCLETFKLLCTWSSLALYVILKLSMVLLGINC